MQHLFDKTCTIYRRGTQTKDAWNDTTGAWAVLAAGVLCRKVQLRAQEQRTGPGGGAVLEIASFAVELPIGQDIKRGDRAVVSDGSDLMVIGVNPDPAGRGFYLRALCTEGNG